jgi:site-specific DNA-methyltransferase (adenine-specific)
MNKGMFTSKTDEWSTPQDLFDELDAEFHFNLDPCCTVKNAKCRYTYTKDEDGLAHSWGDYRVFMNPPYGREIGKWMKHAYGCDAEIVVCLVPARTDTAWWHDYAMEGEVRFIRGRLKFGGSKNSAPFPSAIVIFR